jgi:hypothetical protein
MITDSERSSDRERRGERARARKERRENAKQLDNTKSSSSPLVGECLNDNNDHHDNDNDNHVVDVGELECAQVWGRYQ